MAALVEDRVRDTGEWVDAGGIVVSLLPPGKVKVRFFVPEPELGRVHVGQAGRSALRRLCAGHDRHHPLHRARGRVHAAGDLQRRQPRQAGLHGRGLAGGRHHASTPASPSTCACDEPGHRRARPGQALRRAHRGRPCQHPGRARPDLRLSRPQRQRQDHHHPHAVRPAHARRGQRAPASATTSSRRHGRSSARSAT